MSSLTNLLLILPFLCTLSYSSSPSCTLNPGSVRGECGQIRQCKYQIGRLRVGAPVTECPGRRNEVCCPTQPSIAEKKCMEWRNMLLAPISFGLDPFPTPKCAADTTLERFIVGGRDAEPFEYPHSVALGYGQNQNQLKYACGATLISENFLLTAAHCITSKTLGKPTYAMIGDRVLDPKAARDVPSPYRKLARIVSHIVHPDYKPPLIYNDIALLRMETPLELDRFRLPACIATPLTTPRKSNQVEASGWGIVDAASTSSSNILQAVNISIIDTGLCNQVYGLEADKAYRFPNGIVKSQVCAEGEDKDTCRGDSGGGLYTRRELCLFHIVGITSIGSRICGQGNPAVYTNVASYQDWIESTVWGR